MIVQVNTDKHIQGTEGLKKFVSEKLNGSLKHLADHITRVEVHLSDQNGDKGGPDDIQCKLEGRIEGRQPIVVVSHSNSKEKALDEAAEKLKSSLNSIIGKMKDR